MARSLQATSRGGDQPLTLDRRAIKSSNSKPLKYLIGMEMHVRKPPRLLSRRRTWRINKDCEAEAPAALQHHPKMLDSAPTELVISSPLGSLNNISSHKIAASFCEVMMGQSKRVSGLCGRGTNLTSKEEIRRNAKELACPLVCARSKLLTQPYSTVVGAKRHLPPNSKAQIRGTNATFRS